MRVGPRRLAQGSNALPSPSSHIQEGSCPGRCGAKLSRHETAPHRIFEIFPLGNERTARAVETAESNQNSTPVSARPELTR